MSKRLNSLRFPRVSIFFYIVLILAFLTCIPDRNALALQPPDLDELTKLSASGELEARIAKAKEIGNHRVDNDLFRQAIRKTHREYLKSQGRTEAEIDLLAPMPAPPLSWRGMPTTGNVKPLAILIEFQDYPHTNSRDNIHRDLFGAGLPSRFPYESLSNYYSRASYQQLNISGNTLGWYSAPYNRSSVLQTQAGRENLIKEALNYFNSQGHDFSQYDSNGDGVIDYLIVFWTGPDNGWSSFWWGYFTGFSDSNFTVDGKRVGRYSWQWEARPVGSTFTPNVVIHETGHALGLPDYYDYDPAVGPGGGVGRWDMMDASSNDHNCFSKWLLDWITPIVVASGSQSLSLNASGSSQDAVIIWPGVDTGDLFSEFFMVQNRQPAGNDSNLTCGGMFTWHVDATLDGYGTDFLYDNSYTAHKLLRLMEADGLEEIELGDGLGDCGDLYKSGNSFGPGTAPSSRRYDGQNSSVSMTNFSAPATQMSATLQVGPSLMGIGVFRPSIGMWFLDRNGSGFWNDCVTDGCINFGIQGDIPVTGDWNGDGTTKIGVFRPSIGWWFLDYNGNGQWDGCSTDRCYNFGISEDTPVTGDWDGDGKAEIGVFRKSIGWWFLDYNADGTWSGCSTDRCFNFGISEDTPVTGDWNGDGKTEIGVFRPSIGWWFVDVNGDGTWSGCGADGCYNFGISVDLPVTGDWNGDGFTEIGVFRPSMGYWFLDYSGNDTWNDCTTDRCYQFGISVDLPVSGAF